jgi:hypothetical protein
MGQMQVHITQHSVYKCRLRWIYIELALNLHLNFSINTVSFFFKTTLIPSLNSVTCWGALFQPNNMAYEKLGPPPPQTEKHGLFEAAPPPPIQITINHDMHDGPRSHLLFTHTSA